MTQMALFYAAFALTVLAVLSNRYWRSQIRKTQREADKFRGKVDEIAKDVATVAAHYAALSHDMSVTESRTKRTEMELVNLSQELDTLKNTAKDRYYIFDRLEPRQGRFWEVTVRFQPSSAGDQAQHRMWNGLRRYLVVADSERDAKHRASARFSRKAGFDVAQVIASRIANLSFSRVSEYSTFRRAGNGEEG